MTEIRADENTESTHAQIASSSEVSLQFHSQVQVEVAGISHPGRVRSNNEDHYYIARFGRFIETLQSNLPSEGRVNRSEDASYGMLVADGIGGEAAGEVASREAIQALVGLLLQSPDEWIRHSDDDSTRRQILQRAATRLAQVNRKLREEARTDAALQGFGTTFTAAWNIVNYLFIAHVGDSRAYLYRGSTLERLTRDHTFAQDLADQGVIDPEDISTHRMRHVLTRALGDTETKGDPELGQLQLQDSDSLLLCTDGLTDMLADQQIITALDGAETCEVACNCLLEQALQAGGKDNITVVVARYKVPK